MSLRTRRSERHRAGGARRPASWRRLVSFNLLLVAGIFALSPRFAAAQDDQVGEYELKAAILYNLTKFVEWPASAYAGPQAPTLLCILGRDPFGGALEALAQQGAENGRPVLIRHPRFGVSIRDCHILFISSSERKLIGQILPALKGSNVLTVGDMAQFAARGGMIEFALEDKQVHFQINLDLVSQVGLKISSRLLVLARIIHEQTPASGYNTGPIPFLAFETAVSPIPRDGFPFFMAGRGSPQK